MAAAEARLLEATERQGRIVEVVGVDPDGTCLEGAGDTVGLRDVAGPDSRGETVDRGVALGDRILGVLEADGGQDGSEDLFTRDGVVHVNVVEDGRLDEVAFARADVRALAAGDERRPFALPLLDVAEN